MGVSALEIAVTVDCMLGALWGLEEAPQPFLPALSQKVMRLPCR